VVAAGGEGREGILILNLLRLRPESQPSEVINIPSSTTAVKVQNNFAIVTLQLSSINEKVIQNLCYQPQYSGILVHLLRKEVASQRVQWEACPEGIPARQA